MEREGLRAALYARVSTDRQAERYGLEAQLTALRERARERGYVLVPDEGKDAFSDDGYSGASLERPALHRLRQSVAEGQVDVVLCHDPDRLSRELADLLLLDTEFQRCGVGLEFLTQEVDRSPEGAMFFAIRGAVAQYEKAKIRERTQRGKREEARQGQVVNPRLLPAWLESRDQGRTVELVPNQAETARMIFRLFTHDGLSLRAICRRLHELGIPAPSGRGSQWQPCTVKRWLTHAAAVGEYRQLASVAVASRRPRAGAREHRFYRVNPGRGMTVTVPAIVSRQEWEEAQRRLRRNLEFSRRNARRFYLLRGLMFCTSCGGRMARFIRPDGIRRYRCGSVGNLRRVDGSQRCQKPAQVKADEIEAEVWNRVSALFLDAELLQSELSRRSQEGSPTREALEAELARIDRSLAEIPTRRARLLDQTIAGAFPQDLVREKAAELQAQEESLSVRRQALRADLSVLVQEETAVQSVIALPEEVRRGLAGLTEEERAEFLRRTVRRVEVDGRERSYTARIHAILPVAPPSLPEPAGSGHLGLPDRDRGSCGEGHGPQPAFGAGDLGCGRGRAAPHAGRRSGTAAGSPWRIASIRHPRHAPGATGRSGEVFRPRNVSSGARHAVL